MYRLMAIFSVIDTVALQKENKFASSYLFCRKYLHAMMQQIRRLPQHLKTMGVCAFRMNFECFSIYNGSVKRDVFTIEKSCVTMSCEWAKMFTSMPPSAVSY